MKIEFCEFNSVPNEQLKYAVIAAKHQNNWVFCKHKDRNTWELPGGTREAGEEILKTAQRELSEETGATEFKLEKVSLYSVERDGNKAYGGLFYAEVFEFGKLQYEITEIKEFKELPENLTYPDIQPCLFVKVKKYLEMTK